MSQKSNKTKQAEPAQISDLLAGLAPRTLQSRGLLEVVGLFPPEGDRPPEGDSPTEPGNGHAQYVAPLEHLKLVQVRTYGSMVLRNTADKGMLIAPMHLGFFQEGAQNHATSRVLVLEAGESLTADDCFCIQQSQGGYLKEAQQRFLILPLGLRGAALARQGVDSYSRLWGAIDRYNRSYGIARGGHLERFLRPYFARLQPFRHAFETLPGQVGAAYFIGGSLVGIEAAPNPAYWQELAPILNIYCYGPAALLAARQGWQPARKPLNLDGLADLDDLAGRLSTTRASEEAARVGQITELSGATWNGTLTEERYGLRTITLEQQGWAGQMVREGAGEMVYLSVFHDLVPQAKKEQADYDEDW
jgi:hypothetical protein